MLKKFIKDQYFCGLDIGSQTIKASIVKLQDTQKPQLIGVFEERTSGYQQASIIDLGELSEAIHKVVVGLSKKASIKIKELQMGISGELVDKRFVSAAIPLVDRGSKEITARDIKKIQSQARALGLKMDEVVLHNFPQYYKVDDVNTALNPVGLYGRKLEVYTMLMVINDALLKNLTKAVNQAGFDVEHYYYSSFSSTDAILSKDYKQKGCIVINLGSHITDVLFFKDGHLRFYDKFSFGGAQVTDKIADVLNITFDLAEDIKKSYAQAVSTDVRADEEILIKKDQGYMPIKKEIILEAINPVITNMVDTITECISASGATRETHYGIVMTGGGVMLPGLPELIEGKTNLPVKVGKVTIAANRLHNSAKFAAAVGLAVARFNQVHQSPLQMSSGSPLMTRITLKVKELYQEYF
ncbi:MAG: cell division protein FtsA [Candidatus Omnitrophica bacterium]|nr:cell division protein FtsA [Candidatus Omnitrophota bacterium]